MHIHIPDGVLPFWLWGGGYAVILVLLGLFSNFLRRGGSKIALAAMFTAFSLIVMSVPLGLPVHLNLLSLVGIILGPIWSFYVAFVVNLVLAGFGHGGATIVGLNTLLLWVQAAAAYYLFSYLLRPIFHQVSLRAAAAVFVGLIISFGFLVLLAALPHQRPMQLFAPSHHHHHHAEESEHAIHHHAEEIEPTEIDGHHDHGQSPASDETFNLTVFVGLSGPLFLLVAIFESLIAAGVAGFIVKVRPRMLIR